MTPEEVQHIIATGETLDVEFKAEHRQQFNDDDLVNAVVCLSNRSSDHPGCLLLGVEDDGRITGAKPRHHDRTDPQRLQALIANQTRPSVSVRAHVLMIEGQHVIAIEVPPSRTPVGTSDGSYFRRAIGGDGRPACLPFHFHEMQALQASRGQLDYSAAVVADARQSDLDPLEFERFRRRIRESRGRGDAALLDLPDLELAKSLGAVEANGSIRAVRVLGLLLFGKEESLTRLLPTHEAAFQVLQGTAVAVNDFFRWPLLRIVDEMESRFRARNQETELMVGMLRVGVPDYPEEAFREALANALIHRDYTRLGAVHVQWHDALLLVSSPGGFPEGVGLHNLLVTSPRPRNPLLADAFKRAGIVDRTARGIDKIFAEQLRYGRPAPSYDRSTPTDVAVVLPGGEANLGFARLVAERSRDDQALNLDELLLLNQLHLDRQIDTPAASGLIQKSDTEARRVLEHLVEIGLIEARGSKRGRSFHLSADTYRRLGEKAAYVRQRGFEPIQQEQMVLQYVEKHGAIARRDAADLCRISPPQAKRLLLRLTQQGMLTPSGQGRGTIYGRPSINTGASEK